MDSRFSSADGLRELVALQRRFHRSPTDPAVLETALRLCSQQARCRQALLSESAPAASTPGPANSAAPTAARFALASDLRLCTREALDLISETARFGVSLRRPIPWSNGEGSRRSELVEAEAIPLVAQGEHQPSILLLIDFLAPPAADLLMTLEPFVNVLADIVSAQTAHARLTTSVSEPRATDLSRADFVQAEYRHDLRHEQEVWFQPRRADLGESRAWSLPGSLDDLHPEDRSRYDHHIFALRNGPVGSRASIEVRVLGSGGHTRRLQLREQLIRRAPDGSAVDIAGVIQSVSDSMLTDDDSRRFVDQTTVMMATLSFDGIIRSLNAAVEPVLGWMPGELIGGSVFQVVDESDRTRVAAELGAMAAGNVVDAIEIMVICRDGRRKSTLWSGMPSLEHGLCYVIGQDLSERRRAEMKLVESEYRYRMITQLTSTFSYQAIVNAADRVIMNWVDGNFERTTGYTPQNIASRCWSEIVDPQDVPIMQERLRHLRAASVGYINTVEYRIRIESGETRRIQCISQLIERDDDRLILFGAVQDVTEQRRTEATVRHIVNATAPATGPDFFRMLTQLLTEALDVQNALIARVRSPGAERAETVGFAHNGVVLENVVYELRGTPCEGVVNGRMCYIPRDVQSQFPDDAMLGVLGIVSYFGIPLISVRGEVLGLIAVMNNLPLENAAQVETLLRVVAVRALAELERELVVDQLRDSQRFIERIAQASPHTVYLFDLAQQKVLYTNRNAISESIYTSEDQLHDDGSFFLKYMHPDDLRQLPALMDRWKHAADSDILHSEYRLKHRDGEWHWYHSRDAVFSRSPDGSVDKIVGTAQDVTEQKRSELALRDSEARLRTLLENLPNVAVQAYEPDGTITFWNLASARLYGYSSREAIGRNVVDLLHGPETRDHERRIMAQALASGELPGAEELEVTRRDGNRLTIFSSRILHSRPGREPEFFCFDVDVTERKRAAQELAHRQVELLHASRLWSMGQMVAALSHELSQPLTAIGNFASACLSAPEVSAGQMTGNLSAYLTAIERQYERCCGILNTLREFSRRTEPSRAIVPLHQLLRDSVQLIGHELKLQNIRTRFEFSDDVGDVEGDRVQLEQVFVNLLANARDALVDQDPSRREILLRTGRENGCVRVDVVDQGPGIPPELFDRLFEPFVTTKDHGMGIGLNICRTIIESHAGMIQAIANDHGGATFQVRLPARNES